MAVNEKDLPKNPVKVSFTLRARIDGHEGPLLIEGATMSDVVKVVKLLGDAPGVEVIDAPLEWRTLPDGTPLCPKHNVPMRLRKKQGEEWYSHSVAGEGEAPCYCKGYPGKDSPGWSR